MKVFFQTFLDETLSFLGNISFVIYCLIGILQLFAIVDGVVYATGIDGVLGFFIALFIGLVTTYIPLIGSGLSVYGAINVWDWNWILATLLFFWYVPVMIVFALMGIVVMLLEWLEKSNRR